MEASITFSSIEVGHPFSIGNVEINTIENVHPGKAYSYRFEDQHGIFIQSSDSEYKHLDDFCFTTLH